MKVQIISFNCVLKDSLGKIISSTVNRDVLTGAEDKGEPHLKGLVKGLQNLTAGEKRKIIVPAKDAYGFYDPELVVILPKDAVPDLKDSKNLQHKTVSLVIEGKSKEFRVISVTEKSVTLDGNHSLAGQDLTFEIETTSVRDATPEEVLDLTTDNSNRLLH